MTLSCCICSTLDLSAVKDLHGNCVSLCFMYKVHTAFLVSIKIQIHLYTCFVYINNKPADSETSRAKMRH